MNAKQTIKSAMRRADRSKSKPILHWQRIPTEPSPKPVYILWAVLVVLLMVVIPVAQRYCGEPIGSCEVR